MATSLRNDPLPDLDEFRLRRIIDRMIEAGEVEIVEEPVDLVDMASRMDGNPKAVLFRKAGPDGVDSHSGTETRTLSELGGNQCRGLGPLL